MAPHVTLLEKIEAITRRFQRKPIQPETFVRHFEDAYHIIEESGLPEVERLRALRDEMVEVGDLQAPSDPADPALAYDSDLEVWAQIEQAWSDAAGLFSGDRIPLKDCTERIRTFLTDLA